MKSTILTNKQEIQDKEYDFPYHYLLNLNKDKIDIVWKYSYGFEHFSLIYIIKAILIKKKPNSILDIGCGDGKLIYDILKNKLIKRRTTKVIGIDRNRKAIEFAKIFNDNNKAEFIQQDIFKYKTGLFELVTLMEVIEHIPTENLEKLMKKVFSLIEKEKFLIISVPSINIPLQPKHYNHYDLNSIRKIIDKYFKIEDVYYIGSVKLYYKMLKNIYMIFDFFRFEKIKGFLFSIYKKKFLLTSEDKCIHILILCKKKIL